MVPVKHRVPTASVEVSQIKDNQTGMTSEDHHPVGHAASEKSDSLSTTSIKVSQSYPANSALVPSSVSEVPAIPASMVTSRASNNSALVPSSVSEVPAIPASMVTSRASSNSTLVSSFVSEVPAIPTSRTLSQLDHHQQKRQGRRRRRRRRWIKFNPDFLAASAHPRNHPPVLRVTNASQPMVSPPWPLPLSLIRINPDHRKIPFWYLTLPYYFAFYSSILKTNNSL
jgi:hypothetical protein